MAKNDVELIIAAKDKASSAIKKIADSFNDLQQSADDVDGKLDNSSNSLGKFALGVQKLNKEVAGLKELSKVSETLSDMGKSIDEMGDGIAETTSQLSGLEAHINKLAAEQEKLQKSANDSTVAHDKEAASLKKLKAELKVVESEYRKVQTATSKNNLAIERRGAATENQAKKARELAKSEEFYASKQAEQNALVAKQTALVKKLNVEKTVANKLNNEAIAALKKSEGTAKRYEQSLESQKSAISESIDIQKKLSKDILDTASNINKTTKEQNELGNSAERAAKTVEILANRLRGIQGSTPNIKLPTDSLNSVKSFSDLEVELKRLKQVQDEARASATKLGKEIYGTGTASNAQKAAFVTARVEVIKAKKEYKEYAQIVAGVNRELKQNNLKDAIRNYLQLDRTVAQSAKSFTNAANASGRAAAGVGTWGEHTRRALDTTQRLRGQILGLTTSYIGLYSIVNQVSEVIDAQRSLDAVANRLGVVFDGDQEKVTNEMRYLTGLTNKLGLSLKITAGEYGKFTIASQGAGFSLAENRKLFESIAVAGRVNKLSTIELNRVYKALTQTISKGKVQAEELRNQAGEYLPGAFNLFAEALGYSAAELDKMLERGDVLANRSNLLAFADKLEERFGPQLQKSLTSFAAQLDKLENNKFRGQALVAQGGFIEELTKLIQDLNESFDTKEGREFFLAIGALAGDAVSGVRFLVKHIDLLVLGLKAFASIKLFNYLKGLTDGFNSTGASSSKLSTSVRKSTLAVDAFGKAMKTMSLSEIAASFSTTTAASGKLGVSLKSLSLTGATSYMTSLSTSLTGLFASSSRAAIGQRVLAGSMAVTRTAAIGLLTAVRGLFLALGGPVGIAFMAGMYVIGELMTDTSDIVDDSIGAFAELERQIESLREAQSKLEGTQKSLNDVLEDLSVVEVEANLDKLANAYDKARKSFLKLLRAQGKSLNRRASDSYREEFKQIAEVEGRYKSFQINASQLREELEALYTTLETDSAKDYVKDLFNGLDDTKIEKASKALGEGAGAAKALGSEVEHLDATLKFTGVTLDSVLGKLDQFDNTAIGVERSKQKIEELTKALRGMIPDLAAADKLKAELDSIEKTAADAIAEIEKLKAVAETDQEKQSLDEEKAKILALRDLAIKNAKLDKEADKLRDKANKKLEKQRKILEDIRFEMDQLERTEKERAIADALQSAGFDQNDTSTLANQIREAAEARFELAKAISDSERKDEETRKENQRLEQVIAKQQERLAGIRDRINPGAQTEDQFIRESAKRDKVDLNNQTGAEYKEILSQIFEIETKQRQLVELEKEMKRLTQERKILLDELKQAGDNETLNETKEALAENAANLKTAATEAERLATALGDADALANIESMNSKIKTTSEVLYTVDQTNRDLAAGFTNTAKVFTDGLGDAITGAGNLGDAFENAGKSFVQFAADFLQRIAMMIIQAQILKAIENSGFGGGISGLVNSGVNHSGGIAGSSSRKRSVPTSVFANAIRYHTGGIAGLKPNEVPTILERGEEVLTKNDPRHATNGGKNTGSQVVKAPDVKIINTFDASEMVSKGLDTPEGTEAILNVIKSNSQSIKQAMS